MDRFKLKTIATFSTILIMPYISGMAGGQAYTVQKQPGEPIEFPQCTPGCQAGFFPKRDNKNPIPLTKIESKSSPSKLEEKQPETQNLATIAKRTDQLTQLIQATLEKQKEKDYQIQSLQFKLNDLLEAQMQTLEQKPQEHNKLMASLTEELEQTKKMVSLLTTYLASQSDITNKQTAPSSCQMEVNRTERTVHRIRELQETNQ